MALDLDSSDFILWDFHFLLRLLSIVFDVVFGIKVYELVSEGQDDEPVNEVDHFIRCTLDDILAEELGNRLFLESVPLAGQGLLINLQVSGTLRRHHLAPSVLHKQVLHSHVLCLAFV